MSKSIFILCTYDAQGGAEYTLRSIAEYHAQIGDKVTVFFLKKEIHGYWNYLIDQYKINLVFTTSSKESYGLWRFALNLIVASNKNTPSIVYTSHSHLNSFFDILRCLRLVRTSFHIARESTHAFRRYRGTRHYFTILLYKLGYNKINLLICQTDTMKQDLLTGMPSLKKLKIKVIPNPINISGVSNKAEEQIDEAVISIFKDRKCIVTAGRLVTVKGLDFLIRAFTKLPKDFHLIILGDGDQKSNLETLAFELGKSSNISFLGYKHNPMPYLKNAYLCVVPSILEGFPNILLQMMVLNKRVVSTLCAGGIEEIPGIFTCRPGNSDDLYSAILDCINSDELINNELMISWLEKRNMKSFISESAGWLDKK